MDTLRDLTLNGRESIYRIHASMKRAAIVFLLCAAAHARATGASLDFTDPLAWASSVRGASGLAILRTDDALSRTAGSYARELAARGLISHLGRDGSDALTRYLRNGGTAARVGEILGAGRSLPEVEEAWLKSAAHRSLLLRPYWTHSGWGCATSRGGGKVWVVLFVQKRVEGLEVGPALPDGIRIEGRLLASDVERPVLLSGTRRLEPDYWNAGNGRFVFSVPGSRNSGYVRLGYLSSSGGLVITDVITSPRGTASPEGGVRCEELDERP
jgi:hypothetical protein